MISFGMETEGYLEAKVMDTEDSGDFKSADIGNLLEPIENIHKSEMKFEYDDWQVTVERNDGITQSLHSVVKSINENDKEVKVDASDILKLDTCTDDEDYKLFLGDDCSTSNPCSNGFVETKELVVLLVDIRKCEKCSTRLTESDALCLKPFCKKCKPRALKVNGSCGKVQCSVCLKVFNNISAFYNHSFRCHSRREDKPLSYKCPECDCIFYKKKVLMHHKRVHENSEYFNCDMCSLSFLHKSNLERHIRVKHIQENNYEKVKARHHANISNLLKDRFKCDLCNSSFKGKPSLYHHSRKYHGVELHHPAHVERIKSSLTADGYLQCKECGKKFNQNERFRFRDHASKHKLKTKYKCPNCEKRFPTLRDVEEHQWRHTGIKSYKCGECGMTFPREHNLQAHLVIKHIRERNYECDQCQMKFITKLSFTRHMTRHTTNRISYQCEFCDQCFLDKYSLKEHMLKRTNQVYKCSKCEKKYCNRKARAQHLKSEHNIFVCYVCGKYFPTYTAVVKHRNQHLKKRK